MKEIRIPQTDAGQRLDKYLRKLLPEAGSGFLYKMLRKKNITLNGKKAEGKELLRAEDVVCLFFSEETYNKMHGTTAKASSCTQAEEKEQIRRQKEQEAFRKIGDIEIIYEDTDLLFVNKPTGVLSQGDREDAVSLNDWIAAYCNRNISEKEEKMHPAVCNRLDRNTSGLVLCGKTYAGSRFLTDSIRRHDLRKVYRAVVEGKLQGEGILKGFWTKDKERNIVQISDILLGQDAAAVETAYRVLDFDGKNTLVEVELITGKSHQIRAHMASIGHPLAGDLKYGGHPWKGRRTQLLHASEVRFIKAEGRFSYLADKCFSCTTDWLTGAWKDGSGS